MKTNLSRRMFGSHVSAAAAGVALAACGASDATGSASGKRAVVLVHGAWFGSWSYASITDRLAAAGIAAIAIDLPGHGLDAAFPASYFVRPLDQAAFSIEPSPVGQISLADYTKAIVDLVASLAVAGYERISLVGHSLAGVAITAAAEAAPQMIDKLIYLSAYMPVTALPAGAYFGTPQGMQSQLTPLLMSDYTLTGAARIDPNSEDTTYIAAMKSAFCADASDAATRAMMNMMSCDDPGQVLATPTGATVAGWGSVPRAYIGCSQDKAIPPDLQSLFISEADALAPQNKTTVHMLNSSHCPFLSQPAELAQLIATLAA